MVPALEEKPIYKKINSVNSRWYAIQFYNNICALADLTGGKLNGRKLKEIKVLLSIFLNHRFCFGKKLSLRNTEMKFSYSHSYFCQHLSVGLSKWRKIEWWIIGGKSNTTINLWKTEFSFWKKIEYTERGDQYIPPIVKKFSNNPQFLANRSGEVLRQCVGSILY